MWRMVKGARSVVCTLRTHPLGWELVSLLNNEVHRSQVCKSQPAVFELSDQWRRALEQENWRG
jgi:hypothetical protein